MLFNEIFFNGIKNGQLLEVYRDKCEDYRLAKINKDPLNIPDPCSLAMCLSYLYCIDSQEIIFDIRDEYLPQKNNFNEAFAFTKKLKNKKTGKIDLDDVSLRDMSKIYNYPNDVIFYFYKVFIDNLLTYINEHPEPYKIGILEEWKELKTSVCPQIFFRWLKEKGFTLSQELGAWLEQQPVTNIQAFESQEKEKTNDIQFLRQQTDDTIENKIIKGYGGEDMKTMAIALATEEQKKYVKTSKEWHMLEVGILSLQGCGVIRIAQKCGHSGGTWTQPRRVEFIEHMKKKHNLDVKPFMPEDKNKTS